MRIIFVPQYPVPNRYPEWWFYTFPKEFRKAGFDVHILGGNKVYEMQMKRGTMSMFSPIHAAIEFECAQINEYMSMTIDKSDILFLADLSFPGLFCGSLFHKRPDRMFAFCHATSINYKDYFEKDVELKFPVETTHSMFFDTIFVGSKYHQLKLGWPHTSVTYLPFPPFSSFKSEKEYLISSASRPTPQKVDSELEAKVEKEFGKIVRRKTKNWVEYFKFLSESKILLISSFEDTFGYQIVDAIMNNCIPIAPNRCAYPELLPKEYLYNNNEELFSLIHKALEDSLPVPKLLCEKEMNNFYKNIIENIKR